MCCALSILSLSHTISLPLSQIKTPLRETGCWFSFSWFFPSCFWVSLSFSGGTSCSNASLGENALRVMSECTALPVNCRTYLLMMSQDADRKTGSDISLHLYYCNFSFWCISLLLTFNWNQHYVSGNLCVLLFRANSRPQTSTSRTPANQRGNPSSIVKDGVSQH